MSARRKRIAVMLETTRSFSRDMIRTIARHAKGAAQWDLVLHEHHRQAGIPEWLEHWEGDGVLTRVYDEEFAAFLAGRPYPVINIAGSLGHPALPEVKVDHADIAATAVDFFVNNAFTRFAFCGYPGIWFSDLYESAFLRSLAKRHIEAPTYQAPSRRIIADLDKREEFSSEGSPELVGWIRTLPRRTAIFACNDMRGLQLMIAIRDAGLKVPEDLVVLGAGDESVICELAQPSLSSVRHDADSIAGTACRWLDHRMSRGKGLLPAPIRQRHQVTERASTDVLATDDPLLAKALRFIRSQCHAGIDAGDVLEHVGRSRNTVESRFRQQLGRTISAEILRIRVERARILLERSTLTAEQIGRACGFATAPHFTRRFKDVTSMTPSDYRLSRTGGV